MKNIVFYSKMFQAVHHLSEIQKLTGGTFVTTRASTLKAFKKLNPELRAAKCSKIPVSRGNRILKNADQVITGSIYASTLTKLNAWKAMTFHGTYVWLTPEVVKNLTVFDHLFLIGPRMKQMLERHLDSASFTYETSGFLPFSSYEEHPISSKYLLFSNIFKKPNLPLIIYAPTSWKIGSFKNWAIDIATATPEDCNLLIRPHPRIALKKEKKTTILLNKLSELIRNKTNVALDLNYFNASDIYAHANLIISDANSTAEESLFYDCPQLLIETDKCSRKTILNNAIRDGIHHDDAEQIAQIFDLGPILTHSAPNNIEKMIHTALSAESHYHNNRKEYFKWVFGDIRTEAAGKAAITINEHR